MPPSISSDTAKTLRDTVTMVKTVEAADAKVQPQYKKMSEGLRAGIDNGSEDEIGLYRPQLARISAAIDSVLSSIQGALGLLSQLRQDPVLMETKFDQIEKLLKSMTAKRKKLSEQAGAARKLDAEAEKGVAAAKKGAVSAEADLGALQASVATVMKAIEYVDKEAPKLEAAARKAHLKKDQKGLTEARVALIDFLKQGMAATTMRPRIEKYKKAYPDIPRELKAEVQYMLDDLQRAEDRIKQVDKVVKELVGLGQVKKDEPAAKKAGAGKDDAKKSGAKKPALSAADLAEAGKAIGMLPKDFGKLARILDLPRGRWVAELATLAGQLKLKETDGKTLAALVGKTKGVKKAEEAKKKAQLIDI
jgi:chromosome segregation ATPase